MSHASSTALTTTPLPFEFSPIEVWDNKNPHRDYVITIVVPEFTSVCPMTGLPDYGTITIDYVPDAGCIELKAFKYYILGYRNFGIFYENAVNKILDDIVAAANPRWIRIRGVFTPRGGISTQVTVSHQQTQFDASIAERLLPAT